MPERDDEDRALWRRYRESRPPPAVSPCLDEAGLADLLDGGSGPEPARLAHLVDCPRCLAAFEEARRILRAPLPALPEALLRRLRAIAVAETGRRAPGPGRELAWWAALVAGLVAASSTGFLLGGSAFTDRTRLADPVRAEMALGLGGAPGLPQPLWMGNRR